LLFFNSLDGIFCRLLGKKCRLWGGGTIGQALRRSRNIAGTFVSGTDDRSGKTLLLRALTLVEIANAMSIEMIGCNRHKVRAR